MSAEEPPVSPVVKSNKRMRRRRWIAYAAGGAFVATGLGVAVGPAAPWMVERLDGQRIWRLGRIDIDGVSGGWLGALHADHVTIEDDDAGVRVADALEGVAEGAARGDGQEPLRGAAWRSAWICRA